MIKAYYISLILYFYDYSLLNHKFLNVYFTKFYILICEL